MKTLPASEIAVGHCVIINDVECPEGRMVSVVTNVDGDMVTTKYLNARKEFDKYNRFGVGSQKGTVTPVGWFGVGVCVTSDGKYWCEEVGESSAEYRDGKRRYWQEKTPVRYLGRLELLGLSLLQSESVSHAPD